MKKFLTFTPPFNNKQIISYMNHKWSLARLFKWGSTKYPFVGESLILAHFLNLGSFKKSSISYVIKHHMKERIPKSAKLWLIEKGN